MMYLSVSSNLDAAIFYVFSLPKLSDLSNMKITEKITYIYIYICMYVCMYVCMYIYIYVAL